MYALRRQEKKCSKRIPSGAKKGQRRTSSVCSHDAACSDQRFEYLYTTDLARHGCKRSAGHEAGGIDHALGRDDDSLEGARAGRGELDASNIVLNVVTPAGTCDSCSCSSGGRYRCECSMDETVTARCSWVHF